MREGQLPMRLIPETPATTPSAVWHNVNLITSNANKLREVKAILEPAIQARSSFKGLQSRGRTLSFFVPC